MKRRGRPRKLSERQSVVALRIPDELLDAVKRYCAAEGVSVSDFIRCAITEALEKRECKTVGGGGGEAEAR